MSKRKRHEQGRNRLPKASVYLILGALSLLVLIFVMYGPQSPPLQSSEVQQSLLPSPPSTPGTELLQEQRVYPLPPPPPTPETESSPKDLIGQAIGAQADPCSYADGDASCQRSH